MAALRIVEKAYHTNIGTLSSGVLQYRMIHYAK